LTMHDGLIPYFFMSALLQHCPQLTACLLSLLA
jgi:hypothetical protein